MSVVGEDSAGQDLIDKSKKIMEVFAIDKLSKHSTGGYYSIIGKDGNMNVGFADMSINNNMNGSWILEHKRHLSLSSWIIADTNISKDAVEALIEYSSSNDIKLAIIGVSGPKMKNVPDDLNGVEIIICNLDESQTYFKTKSTDLKHLVKLWLDAGVKKAVITNGKDGCVFGDDKLIKHQMATIVSDDLVVDVTGAGDAFSSAVFHGLINNESLELSVKYGSISSSKTIQSKYSVNPKLSINLIKKELKKNENI
jgi:sugar/nucleoside kinase (ribokinase family)